MTENEKNLHQRIKELEAENAKVTNLVLALGLAFRDKQSALLVADKADDDSPRKVIDAYNCAERRFNEAVQAQHKFAVNLVG